MPYVKACCSIRRKNACINSIIYEILFSKTEQRGSVTVIPELFGNPKLPYKAAGLLKKTA